MSKLKDVLELIEKGFPVDEIDLGAPPVMLTLVAAKAKRTKLVYPLELYIEHHLSHNIKLRRMSRSPERWGIIQFNSNSLSKTTQEFEYSRLPSQRDEDFFTECRWTDPKEAVDFYFDWKRKTALRFIEQHKITDVTIDQVMTHYWEL